MDNLRFMEGSDDSIDKHLIAIHTKIRDDRKGRNFFEFDVKLIQIYDESLDDRKDFSNILFSPPTQLQGKSRGAVVASENSLRFSASFFTIAVCCFSLHDENVYVENLYKYIRQKLRI